MTWKPLYRHRSMHDAVQPPHARHYPGAHPNRSPYHQLHVQHATLPFCTAHAASIASPDTATLFSSVPPSPLGACTYSSPRTTVTTCYVCSARHGRSASPAPPLSPPRTPSASLASRTLPVHAGPSVHLQHDTDYPQHAQPSPVSLHPLLEASSPSDPGSTTWSTTGVRSKAGIPCHSHWLLSLIHI